MDAAQPGQLRQGRFDRTIEAALGLGTACVLFSMMVLTCVDVVGRYFFNSPVQGGLELTEMMLAATIFSAMPLVTLREEHVVIDLLDSFMPDWLLRVQHIAACLVGAFALSVLTWRLWVRGEQLQTGETTAVLGIPVAPYAYGMSALMAFNIAILLVLAFRTPRRQSPVAGG
jgi:TRAP-type C4-dicarboxylate transport system permease small subunit